MGIYQFNYGSEGMSASDYTGASQDFRSDTEKTSSSLSLYNNDAPEIKLARQLAEEMINTSGAIVKVFVRTDNNDFDAVWDEDADPTYWTSVEIKAFFKPAPLETELKKWGADTINKSELVFSHYQVLNAFGERMLRPGDVIQIPFNSIMPDRNPTTYKVLNGTPTGNYRYTWLYFSCAIETLNADIAVRPHEVSEPSTNELIRSNGAYRESY